MIAAHTDRVAPRQGLHAVFDTVANETNRMFNRKYPGSTTNHLLQDIVLGRGADSVYGITGFFCKSLVHGKHDRCYGIDGEPGPDPIERNTIKSDFKIPQGIDSHTHPADFPGGIRAVGV